MIIRVPDADPSLIASLVWGGMIDEIIIKDRSAEVIFASAEDCDQYYDIGRKGIPYKRKGSDKIEFAYVDKGPDVNVVGGLLQTYLDQGFTRCVRVTNVPEEFTIPQLRLKARLKGRRLEGIEDGSLSTGVSLTIICSFMAWGGGPNITFSSDTLSSVSAPLHLPFFSRWRSSARRNGTNATSIIVLTRQSPFFWSINTTTLLTWLVRCASSTRLDSLPGA